MNNGWIGETKIVARHFRRALEFAEGIMNIKDFNHLKKPNNLNITGYFRIVCNELIIFLVGNNSSSYIYRLISAQTKILKSTYIKTSAKGGLLC